MRKIVLTFGIVAGAIVATVMLISMYLVEAGKMEASLLLGYASMVLALSVIFPAIKSYRDKEQGGAITFGKALLIGLIISAIASCIYAIGWEIFISSSGMSAVDLTNKMYEGQVTAMKEAGATAEELAQYQIGDWYNTFILRYLFTAFGEMFPVGLIISLICAAILRKKSVLPTTTAV
ncbi:MAG: DUF4199 domain-containing protein [Flavipsychrobacter sp.]